MSHQLDFKDTFLLNMKYNMNCSYCKLHKIQ